MTYLPHPKLWLMRAFTPVLGALSVALLLQGCGGSGSASSGLNSSPQVASGVVTGFGSVFVDGVEIEDANAPVVTESASGATTNTVLQMGQHIRVEHNGAGTASKVTIEAALVGVVSSIDTANLNLTVAAQSVTINTDSTVGPLTVFAGGYSSIADIASSDMVEIHGTPVYDSLSKSYKLAATRIQKMTAIANLLVSGKISNLDVTAKTFSLNGLTVSYASASLRPNNAVLANDMVVTAYAPTSGLSGSTLTASNLRLNRLQDSSATAVSLVQLSGTVSLYNSTDNSFEIQGFKVSATNATIKPSGAKISNQAYVRVDGSLGSDGSVTATAIQVREQSVSSDLAVVKLIGVISDYVDTSSFIVRGVPVDASAISITSACPGVTLANGTEVQVVATQQSGTPVVLASSLTCKPATTALLIRPMDGTISNVNATAKTFTLTPISGFAPPGTTTQSVQWNDATTFVGLTSSTLTSQQVRVEGYLSSGVLVAKLISNSSINTGLDMNKFQRRSMGDTSGSEWNLYRSNHRH